MTEFTDDRVADRLSFDRVQRSEQGPANTASCSACNRVIGREYYAVRDRMLCTTCGERRQRETEPDRSAATLLRVTSWGAGAAIAGSLLYFAVLKFLGLEIGIVALVIGYMVGEAVKRASRVRGTKTHRVLAALLVYLAIGLAYALTGVGESSLLTLAVLIPVLPVLSVFQSMPGGVISLVIFYLGIQRAWRISGAHYVPVTGPHLVTTRATA